MKNDLGLVHLLERQLEHPRDRAGGEGFGLEIEKPRLQMPAGFMGFNHAPDAGWALFERIEDLRQGLERPEDTVVRQQDPVGAIGAALPDQVLPGAKIEACVRTKWTDAPIRPISSRSSSCICCIPDKAIWIENPFF